MKENANLSNDRTSGTGDVITEQPRKLSKPVHTSKKGLRYKIIYTYAFVFQFFNLILIFGGHVSLFVLNHIYYSNSNRAKNVVSTVACVENASTDLIPSAEYPEKHHYAITNRNLNSDQVFIHL